MSELKMDINERELESFAEEASKYGAVFASLHFDAHGSDEQAVKDALVDLVARLSKENGVLYCKGAIEEALKGEGSDMWSSCMEVKVLAESLSNLMRISLRYGPVAVEVFKPSKITLDIEEAQALLIEASQTAQDYTRYILEKVLTPEEKAKLQERMRARVELGRKLVEKPAEKPAEASS